MEIGIETQKPNENKLELNESLSAVINFSLTTLETNFNKSYQGQKNGSYKKFCNGIFLLEDAFLTPEDADLQGNRYVVREEYLDQKRGGYHINLAPLNKLNSFGKDQYGNPNLDLNDGSVDECQILITKFEQSTSKTDESLSNSGYKIDVIVKNYSFVQGKGVVITPQPAGLGIVVRNDGSATCYLKNFMLKDFNYVKPPTTIENVKDIKGSIKYISGLKITSQTDNSLAAIK